MHTSWKHIKGLICICTYKPETHAVCGVIKPTIRHSLIDLHEFSGDFVIQVFGCRQPLTNPGVELTLFFGIATRRVDELIMFK